MGPRGGFHLIISFLLLPLILVLMIPQLIVRRLSVSAKMYIVSELGTSEDLQVAAGDPLILNCKSDEQMNTSSIRFEKGSGREWIAFPTDLYSYRTDKSKWYVQFRINDTQPNGDGESFRCSDQRTNATSWGGIYVAIADIPEVVRDISFWSNNLEDISVQFCFHNSKNKCTHWSVILVQRNFTGSRKVFNNSRVLNDPYPVTRCEVITWAPEAIEKYPIDVIIFVENRNVRVRKSSSFTFHPLDGVKPNPAREFACETHNSTTLTVSWRNPLKLHPTTLPLVYHLELQSEWNETRQFSNEQMTSRFASRRRRHRNDVKSDVIYSVVVDSLIPFTVYNISLRSRPNRTKGFWSNTTDHSIQMPDDAPSHGPEIFSIQFVEQSCSGKGRENPGERNVTVVWKELPMKLRNGRLDGYRVTLRKVKDNNAVPLTLGNYTEGPSIDRATFQVQCEGNYSVEVTACTRAGCSPPSHRSLSFPNPPLDPPVSYDSLIAITAIVIVTLLVVIFLICFCAAKRMCGRLRVPIKMPERYFATKTDQKSLAEGSARTEPDYAQLHHGTIVETLSISIASPSHLGSSTSATPDQTATTVTSYVPQSSTDEATMTSEISEQTTTTTMTTTESDDDVSNDVNAPYSRATAGYLACNAELELSSPAEIKSSLLLNDGDVIIGGGSDASDDDVSMTSSGLTDDGYSKGRRLSETGI